jgi:hypothetical protein
MMNPLHTGGSARVRFNGARLNLGASSRRVIMVRKLVLILAAAAAVGGAAFTPAAASAGWYGYGHRADIRADRRDLRRDRADFRHDFGDLRRDLRSGRFGEACTVISQGIARPRRLETTGPFRFDVRYLATPEGSVVTPRLLRSL